MYRFGILVVFKKKGSRDYNEFLQKAQKYINAEEAKFAAESVDMVCPTEFEKTN